MTFINCFRSKTEEVRGDSEIKVQWRQTPSEGDSLGSEKKLVAGKPGKAPVC